MFFTLVKGRIEKATRESAAFDVFYDGPHEIYVNDKPIAVPTGVFTEFDKRLVAVLKEKSGLGLKGLELKAGVIDADYRKEWKVVLRNPMFLGISERYVGTDSEGYQEIVTKQDGWQSFCIKPGMNIAQFLLIELPQVNFTAHEGAEICFLDAVRDGGFGSTEKK